MKTIVIGAGLLVLACSVVESQQFEVVSVRPGNPNGSIVMRDMPGQATYTGITVKMLIEQAYGLRGFQVFGGPAWIDSNRYDIAAKAAARIDFPADPTTATDQQREALHQQRQAMLQAMLADRFKLHVHKETRKLPVYVLSIAKGGPKLNSNGSSISNLRPGTLRVGRGVLVGAQISMNSMVQALSQTMDRQIVDKTGLSGNYDFDLKWNPDQVATPLSDPDGEHAQPLADAPTIFTALRDQLGLRLDSSKAPTEVLVIDQVETPEAN
jgi:uncharacterized protein (TIGR03435 family)